VVYPGDPCTVANGKTFNAVGACSAGAWGCVDLGAGQRTAACIGAKGPSPEVCTDGGTPVDENCDGTVDEGCGCVANTTQPCGTGACAGTQTCSTTGKWGACSGAQAGKPDCRGTGDNDCNGVLDRTQADCLPCRGTGAAPAPVSPKNVFGQISLNGKPATLVGCGGNVAQDGADLLCRKESSVNLDCQLVSVDAFLGLAGPPTYLADDYWTSQRLYSGFLGSGCRLQTPAPLVPACSDGRLCANSGSGCETRPCRYAEGTTSFNQLGCGTKLRSGAGALCACR
jgi:hypothetical protein